MNTQTDTHVHSEPLSLHCSLPELSTNYLAMKSAKTATAAAAVVQTMILCFRIPFHHQCHTHTHTYSLCVSCSQLAQKAHQKTAPEKNDEVEWEEEKPDCGFRAFGHVPYCRLASRSEKFCLFFLSFHRSVLTLRKTGCCLFALFTALLLQNLNSCLICVSLAAAAAAASNEDFSCGFTE